MQLHQFFRFMSMQASPIELFSDTLKWTKKKTNIHKQWDEIKNVHLFHLKCTYYFKNYRRFHCSSGKKNYSTTVRYTHLEKRYTFLHKCLMCTDMIRLTAAEPPTLPLKKNLTKNFKYSSGAEVQAVSK